MKNLFIDLVIVALILSVLFILFMGIDQAGSTEVETYEFTATITHMEQNATRSYRGSITYHRMIYYVNGETAGYLEVMPDTYARYQVGDFITLKVTELESRWLHQVRTSVEVVEE